MNKLLGLIGFILTIILFGLVLSSAIHQKNWTNWINVVCVVLIGGLFVFIYIKE